MGRGRQDWVLCRFNPDLMLSLVTKSRLQFSLDARRQAPNDRIRKTGLQTLGVVWLVGDDDLEMLD